MLTLPETYATLIAAFAPVFTQRLWVRIQVLVVGCVDRPNRPRIPGMPSTHRSEATLA